MTYIELLRMLEQRLGYQHLPLNPHAPSMKNLFESTPVHHELMQRTVQALYRANACHALTDSVNRDACFEAIGAVRQETLKIANTDVDAYRLLDDMCHALAAIFQPTPEPVTTEKEKRPAEILPFRRRGTQ
jgi:hypothetical protein